MKSILLIKKFLGLVEMTFGLVYASLSLAKWQAVKMTFFAPCYASVSLIVGSSTLQALNLTLPKVDTFL